MHISGQQLLAQRTTLRSFICRGCGGRAGLWQGVLRDFSALDESVGNLCDLDERYRVIEKLLPYGDLQHRRKTWRYYGGVRRTIDPFFQDRLADPYAVRDPGNYTYGLLCRLHASLHPVTDERHPVLKHQLNDEKLGDVLEAILGVAWMCRHGRYSCRLDAVDILNEYTVVIEQCVIHAEKVIGHTVAMGIWEDSKTLAELLL